MRLPLITLAVGFFILAQSFPTPENVTSTILVPRADPSGKVHWTIHETCYTGDDADNKMKAVLDSVQIAKDRSRHAVESLEKWRTECRSIMAAVPGLKKDIKSNCKLLLRNDKWDEMIDTGIKFLKASSEIEGPIGGGDSKFEKSDDWQNLRGGGEHYNNFIIYCAPDLEPRRDEGQDKVWDKGQERWYDGRTLINFRNDWAQNHNVDPDQINLGPNHPEALTLVNDYAFLEPGGARPIQERRGFAATITLNPSKLRKESIDGYKVQKVTEEHLAKALNAKMTNGVGQIELLVGLPGTIHHEMFHTWGLGRLTDGPDQAKAYGWNAMTASKDQTLPEYFMYLGLLLDLTLWGVRVTPEGNLERMKH